MSTGTFHRKIVPVSLIILSALVLVPTHYVATVRASSSQPWSFRDDFNYTSINQTEAGGWSIDPSPYVFSSQYGFLNSTLTEDNRQSGPGAWIARNDVPANSSDWSLSVRSEYLSGVYDSLQIIVPTAGHMYDWEADSYQGQPGTFTLNIDYAKVVSFPGYTPHANVWHVLQLDMIKGTLYMYFDGTLLGSYVEPDKTLGNTNLTEIKVSASDVSKTGFDWVQATNSPTPPTPFFTLTSSTSSATLAYHQSLNATITVMSEGGFTGNVNLVASSQSGGPSVTMIPANVRVANGGSALSTLELQAPPDPISIAAYSVNVTGSDGALSKTVTITVLVDTHAPVYINGNSGFTAANGVSGGSGTKSDPYIISGFAIDLCQPGKVCGGWGIFISNTNASFIISNIYIHSSGPMRAFGYYDADVYLSNVANAVIENSTLADDRSGVTVSGSTNVTISINGISDVPIYTVSSSGTTYQVTGPCITVSSSTSIVVSGNSLGPCVGGISVTSVVNLLVFHNNLLTGTSTIGAPFAAESGGSNDKWDNGYPSGGNFWANYNGTDNCSGPQQNVCPSADGIGDTPYTFSSGQDNYPLMKPFSGPSPSLSITSTASFDGFTITSSGSLSINSGTVSGTISVSVVNSTSGSLVRAKAYTISNLKLNGNWTRFILNIAVSPDPLSADVSLRQIGGVWSITVAVTRQLDIAARGTVDIVDVGMVTDAFDSYPGSALYSPGVDVAGRGSIDIVDVALLFAFYGASEYS